MQLVIGDALAIALLEARGFTADHFHTFHPGGRLGANLLKVSEIMHTGERLPLVPSGAGMREAILEISRKGFGCVGVVGPEGLLSGIITDGDLRRHVEGDLLSMTVDQVMTREPKTVGRDTLAATALQIINSSAITALIIADGKKPLAGMHDLADLEQVRAKAAAGMERMEMIGGEAPRLEEGDRKRVADDKLHERGCRRREPVRAGLADTRQEKDDVGRTRQCRFRARRYRDQRNRKAPRIGDDTVQLDRFPRPRHGDDGVVTRDHAQIAVIGFRRMDEEGRGARRGKRGRELRADMAALADAGDDHPSGNARNRFDRVRERLGKPVVEGRRECGDAGLFGTQGSRRGKDGGALFIGFQHEASVHGLL
jgi:CBS domain-containing protein